jgi:hypothetical protein
MHLTVALLALAVIPPELTLKPEDVTHFTSYTRGVKAARSLQQPLLVILNPPMGSEKAAVSIDDLRKTRQRRELLEDYVVAVLDTGTEHGRICYELFGRPELPRVVVIDKHQKYQIFQTSEDLYGQLWTTILEKHRAGEWLAVRPAVYQQPGPAGAPWSQPGAVQQPGWMLQQQQFCRT